MAMHQGMIFNSEPYGQNVALDRPSFSAILGEFRRRPGPNSGRGHRPSSKAPEVDAFFDMYFKFLKSNLGKLDLSTALDLLIDAAFKSPQKIVPMLLHS
jgi:hypothetical protein